ncbi:MAG TPA: TonB-dependent receptor [Rhizomicrobium sp.]|nr:TonB-dependent receptor [Rhizomicrobium sp.]
MRKSLLLSTSAFIVLGAATAASADDSAETVVVTATRIPTPESQVASSMTVITADDIAAKGLDTLPDVLADAPGLNVVQAGGPGGQTSVFMRGTNANHVKVLVDGIDVSDPSSTDDSFDFGQFLTPDIARIEILRGPQSGLYGSDAIGGVINIITKSGEGPAQFTAGVEGGSFDTFNQTGGVSGSEGGFHYVANIEHFYSGATPVTPLDLLAPSEVRNDDRYDNVTASTKLGYDVTDNLDLGFVGRYTNSQLHFTGDNYNTGYPDATQSDSSVLEYFSRATAHLVLFDGFFEQTLGFAYSSTSSNDLSPDDGPSPYAGDRIKVDWQGNLRLSDSETLVIGAEHERDEIRVPLSAGVDIDSGYAELQSTLFGKFFNALSLRYDSNDQFGDKLTFREAPEYLIAATGTTLKGSIGTGFKAPTLSELYQNFPSYGFYANPDLKPETSTGYDVGFEQSLVVNAVQFGATYYRNDIKNLIDYNATFTSFVNVGEAETDGVEAFIAYQPIKSLNLRADYTYTEANDEVAHLELERRPKNKISVDARWHATEALSFDADILYVSSWTDTNREGTAENFPVPGYTTTNVAVNYDVNKTLTIYGRVSNIFDEHYQDPDGFLRPGRGFFAGIKAKI